MDEFKTFIKNNRLLFIALAIFLCVGIWFSFGAGSRTHNSGSGVHDNGERADAVDTRLEQLASSNIKLARDCRTLKTELAKSQAALSEAQAQTKKLQAELTALKQQSSSNELLLQTANDSLELYAKEVKRQQRIIKTQRNIAWVLLGGALAVAIAT